MKIYIATSGEYSDYHIDAVFADRNAAEEFTRDNGNHADVEEYEVFDQPLEHADVLVIWFYGFWNDMRGQRPWKPGEQIDHKYNATYHNWPPPACHVERDKEWIQVSGTDHERVRKVWTEQFAGWRLERERRGHE